MVVVVPSLLRFNLSRDSIGAMSGLKVPFTPK